MTFLSIKQNTSPKNVYLEDDAEEVFKNLNAGKDVDYFYVNTDGATPILEAVSIKTGTRSTAPTREIAEIEAGGSVVGSAEVNK